MSSNCCRSCGKTCGDELLKVSINDIVDGKLTFKEIIENNMNAKLDSNNLLPQKICEVCRAQLSLIAALGSSWKSNENALLAANNIRAAISQIAFDFMKEEKIMPPKGKRRSTIPKIKVKTETEERKFFSFEKAPNSGEGRSSSKNSKSFNAFTSIRELFAEELAFKDILKELEDFTHIHIDFEHLNDEGEISSDWLKDYQGTKKWTDFTYQCGHCNTEITGLLAYMTHLKSASINSFKVRCGEKNCVREFAALYSFINHSTEHHQHLAFSCVFCEPTRIFLNIPCLINHYMKAHADMNFQLYVCVECAHYCQSMTQLRVHKMSVHDTVQEVDQTSSDDSDDEFPKKPKTSNDCDWKMPVPGGMKRSKSQLALPNSPQKQREKCRRRTIVGHEGKHFHPKVREIGNRKTYPCTIDGCNRVLISQAGYEYHLLTHSGEKPFKCRHCVKEFRTNALLITHEFTKHSVPKP